MNAYKAQGFSLVELMVAIFIISLLAAVSGPAYRSYLVKSKFTEVLGTVAQYKEDLQTNYLDSDQFSNQFSGLTVSTYTLITSDVIKLIFYGRATDKRAAYLQFFTKDLGVDSFSLVADNGTGGAKCRVTLAAVMSATGQMQYYCGQWDGGSLDVPTKYLPNSCQDTNISAYIS